MTQPLNSDKARFFLASIVESSQDAIVTIDFGGIITSWNRAAEHLYGFCACDAVGQSLMALTLPQNLAEVLNNVEQVKHSQRVEVFDSVRTHKQGQEITLEMVMSPVKDEQGDVIGVSIIARDVTLGRLSDEALRHSEEKYRKLFSSIDEGYCIIEVLFDSQGQPFDWRFLEVNPAFEKNNGLTNAAGKTILELAPTIEPKWFDIYGRVARTGEPLRFQEHSVALGRWFNLYAFRIGSPDENHVAVIFTDISENKRVEAALKAAQEELESRVQERTQKLQEEVAQRRQLQAQRNRLMQRIVQVQEEERGRIARELHDNLGQHLTAILMAIQVINNQKEDLPVGERRASAKDLNYLQDITNDLTDIAHRLAWELRPAALDEVGLAGALRDYISNRKSDSIKVHFTSTLTKKETGVSREAETALYRVMQEALTNVQRHAEASHVSVILEGQAQPLTLIVEDNGQGFNLETAIQKNRLGLVGMRERMELVGGTLEIESSIGNGTTIYARVPQRTELSDSVASLSAIE